MTQIMMQMIGKLFQDGVSIMPRLTEHRLVIALANLFGSLLGNARVDIHQLQRQQVVTLVVRAVAASRA
jgi:hypothetical protein